MLAENQQDVNDLKPNVWRVVRRSFVDLLVYCYVILPIAMLFILNSFYLAGYLSVTPPEHVFSLETFLGALYAYISFMIVALYICLILHLKRVGLKQWSTFLQRIHQVALPMFWGTFLYMGLIIFGILLLVLPGLYAMFTLMFYSIEMFLSGTGGRRSLYNSWSLARHFKWWIFKAVLFISLATMTINIIYLALEFNFVLSDAVREVSTQVRAAIVYALTCLFIVNMHLELKQVLQARQNARTAKA